MENRKSEHMALWAAGALALTVGVALLYYAIVYYYMGKDSGTFGDTFGAMNAVFTGYALVMVAYSLKLQRDELRLQREELRRSTEAMEATALAQAKQVEHFRESAELSRIVETLRAHMEFIGHTRIDENTQKGSRDKALSLIKILEGRFPVEP